MTEIRAVAFAAAVALNAASAAGQGASPYITIRTTSALPEAVIEYVADVSVPTPREIAARDRPEAFITRACGIYTKGFEKVFYKRNPTLAREPSPKARRVQMPACVKWKRNAPVRIMPGDDIDKLLLRVTGRGGNDLLKTCSPDETSSRCNKTFRDLVTQLNPGRDINRLEPGQELVAPVVSEWTTFKVRADAGVTPEQVTNRINEIAKVAAPDIENYNPIIKNVVAAPVRLIKPVSADELDPGDRACREAGAVAGRAWPYDSDILSAIIERNLKHAENWDHNVDRAVVTVIDTGLDKTFPKERLVRDDQGVFGLGIAGRDIHPFPAHDAAWHGTQVTDIVTGGTGLLAKLPALPKLLRSNVVNLIQPSGSPESYDIQPGGILEGVDYAARTMASLANVSIGSQALLPNLRDTIQNHDRLLLVVAAGNEEQALGEFALYPANFGGLNREVGTQVVTVAAHDGEGKRAQFSNWSGLYVDLFAPGCDLPWTRNAAREALHGTSFAAPLVSMTAALLSAFTIKDPTKIKNRLHAAVDYDPALEGYAVSAGRLNIAKAISLYEDVVQAPDGGLRVVRWKLPSDVVQLCAEFRDVATIRKVTRLGEASPTQLRILVEDTEGSLSALPTCDAAEPGLSVTNDDGAEGVIPWSEIADFVPGQFRWKASASTPASLTN
jgi:subtilisin family serine protease